MRRMTKVLRFGGIALLLVSLAGASGAFATESGHQDAIQRALASSALPPADRAAVQSRAAAAINAGVPAEDVEIIVSRGLNRGAEAGAINRFLDISVSAKRSGLPAGPVLNRIEQGLSKGVPPERIAAASERLAEKLRVAQPIVDTLIRGGMAPRRSAERKEAIEASARALEQSIPAADIEGMGSAVKSRGGQLPLFTSAVDTAAYFAGSGVSSKTASRLVQSAVEKGYSTKDMDSLVKQMNNEMRKGVRAEEAAARMERETMETERDMNRKEMMENHGEGAGSMPGMGGMGGTGGMGGPRR